MAVYTIKGDYITDHSVDPATEYYVREVADPYSSEYTDSHLTDDQRRAMFDAIGLKAMTEALANLFAHKGYSIEEASKTVKLAHWRLHPDTELNLD